MDKLIKVCQDLLVYLEQYAENLPEGSKGTFRERNPEALRDRLRVELDAQEILSKDKSK